jgi:ubiquinone biosynthesis protein UbiJ
MTSSLGFFISPRDGLARVLCTALNHLLASEPLAREKLRAHHGKTLRLEGAALLNVALTVQTGDSFAPAADDAVPTLTLTIDVPKAANLTAQGRDVAGAVTISGDAEFAAAVGWLGSNLRWEFEEDVAKLIGEAGAHRLGQLVRAVGSTMRRTADDTEAMLKRGFAETGAPLLSRLAFEPIRSEVMQLRDATARLEKRLELLERADTQNKVSSNEDKVNRE